MDAVCNRAIIIAGGKLLADATPSNWRRAPRAARLDDVFRQIAHRPEDCSVRAAMHNVKTIFGREFSSYFATPLAMPGLFVRCSSWSWPRPSCVPVRQLLRSRPVRPRAVLQLSPWLGLFLIPAISMRLWAEERKSGSIEAG